MRKPIISVIIPVYNAEKYLRECLESVQNQTFKDLEIICVNDGSTDNSLEILEEFARSDKRFVVVSQKNQGLNAVRAAAYKKATGKYVAFVDNDDFVSLDMYEKMLSIAMRNNSEVVICNYDFFPKKIRNKEKWYRSYNGKNDWHFVARNTVPWNKLYKKTLLDKLEVDKLFTEIGENVFSVILFSAKKIVSVDDVFYHYRVGHGSLSTNYNNIDWYKNTVDYNLKRYNYSKKYNFSTDTQDYFYYGYLYYNLVLMFVAVKNGDRKTYNAAKKIVKENMFFSDVYRSFFRNSITFPKRMFFRFVVYPNYGFAKKVTRLMMR